MEYVQCEQGYAVQVRHIISTSEHFWYKWSTSSVWIRYRVQARHIIKCWKREALIHCTITGQIFHAFDELYLLIISVFNTTGNVIWFPSQESTRVENFLVLTFITFCHKYWYWSWVTLLSHWQGALGMLHLKKVAWVFLLVSNQESIGFCVL